MAIAVAKNRLKAVAKAYDEATSATAKPQYFWNLLVNLGSLNVEIISEFRKKGVTSDSPYAIGASDIEKYRELVAEALRELSSLEEECERARSSKNSAIMRGRRRFSG